MNSRLKFLASITAVVAVIVLSQTACDTANSDAAPKSGFLAGGLRKGFFAPDIQGSDLEGNPMKLSDFLGKVVVLEFWAST